MVGGGVTLVAVVVGVAVVVVVVEVVAAEDEMSYIIARITHNHTYQVIQQIAILIMVIQVICRCQ